MPGIHVWHWWSSSSGRCRDFELQSGESHLYTYLLFLPSLLVQLISSLCLKHRMRLLSLRHTQSRLYMLSSLSGTRRITIRQSTSPFPLPVSLESSSYHTGHRSCLAGPRSQLSRLSEHGHFHSSDYAGQELSTGSPSRPSRSSSSWYT